MAGVGSTARVGEQDAMDEPGWAGEAEFQPPFDVVEPRVLAAPLIFDSPHSGSRYPQRFLAASRLDPLTLRRSEDAFVDELFLPCVALGAPLLRAHFPRAFLDVNREPFELDPQMFDGPLPEFANTRSLRVAAGLGAIPRVVGDAQPIYKGRIAVADALARIAALHRPYHERLSGLVERARARFGLSILIDCHSMPSTLAEGGRSTSCSATDSAPAPPAGWSRRSNRPCWRGAIASAATSPMRAATSPSVTARRRTRGTPCRSRSTARSIWTSARMLKLERARVLAEALFAAAEALMARVVVELGAGRLAAE